MASTTVEVPEEVLGLLRQSQLGGRPEAEQVRVALAIHLLQEELVSLGRAAELAGEPLANFQLLLANLGIPAIQFDRVELAEDLRNLDNARGSGAVA